jgi:hypothetical protein
MTTVPNRNGYGDPDKRKKSDANELIDQTKEGGRTERQNPAYKFFATGTRIATVEELRALCKQAQCGVRNETVTDLSARKTLRASPSKVGVEWAGLQAALAQLEREGFLRGPVTAELHDVLLYSPGDFFKPHVDTKKGPKHLMTLAVDTGLCAPSYGGELVLGTTTKT